jgi:hypothetical protein
VISTGAFKHANHLTAKSHGHIGEETAADLGRPREIAVAQLQEGIRDEGDKEEDATSCGSCVRCKKKRDFITRLTRSLWFAPFLKNTDTMKQNAMVATAYAIRKMKMTRAFVYVITHKPPTCAQSRAVMHTMEMHSMMRYLVNHASQCSHPLSPIIFMDS